MPLVLKTIDATQYNQACNYVLNSSRNLSINSATDPCHQIPKVQQKSTRLSNH